MDQSAVAPAPAVAIDDASGELLTWIVVTLAVISTSLIIVLRWHRLPPRPPAGVPPLQAIALYFGFYLARLIGAAIAAAIFDLDISAASTGSLTVRESALLSIGAYLAQALVVVAYVVMLELQSRSDHYETRPRASRAARTAWARSVIIGAAAFVLIWPVVQTIGMFASLLVQQVTGEPTDPLAHETLRDMARAPIDQWFWLMAAIVSIAAPVCEEVAYRGLLQPTLRRFGISPWLAILLTSVVFALMHISAAAPQAVAALFIFGTALGWARERTGSLAAPIAMHMLFNAANLALASWLT